MSPMSNLDPTTGYPPGYVPGWWRCPECGELWHDSEQRGEEDVAWSVDPSCGCCAYAPTMSRIGRLEALWRRAAFRFRCSAVLIVAVLLAGCSLTPTPAPARFHAAYWCPVETPDLACDGGMGVSLATWQVDRYGRWVSAVGVLGADTLGGGLAWTINQGSDRMPLIAVGAGGVCPYDSEAGISTSGCGPVLGVTAGWGGEN